MLSRLDYIMLRLDYIMSRLDYTLNTQMQCIVGPHFQTYEYWEKVPSEPRFCGRFVKDGEFFLPRRIFVKDDGFLG